MRIVIDLQGAQGESRNRGIGRYSLAIAQAIARNRGNHEVIIALGALLPEAIDVIRAAFVGILPADSIKIWHAAGPVDSLRPDNAWRRKAAEYIREAFLSSLNPDIVFITSLFEGYGDDAVNSIGVTPFNLPVAVTMHDLIPLMQRDVYLDPQPNYSKFYLQKIEYLKKANLYMAISDSSEREVLEHLHATPESVVNTQEGVDAIFKKLNISRAQGSYVKGKYGITRKFLMYSGATDERKNHLRLIKAYSLLPANLRSEYQLAIVGKLPDAHREKFNVFARLCGLNEDELIITGRVSDKDLVYLYNLSELFVFPSWHEGFGLPALESMSCGTPVIGANNTSLPEVIGREDALFNPFDEQDIASKIRQFLENDVLRSELANYAYERSKQFTWDHSAKIAIKKFEGWISSNKIESADIDSYSQWLIDNIPEIKVDSQPSESDWIEIAKAISKTFRENEGRQLFLDISELVQRDAKSGVQRVVRSILAELLKNPPVGYRVEPVYAQSGEPGYRYARRFVAKFLGKKFDHLSDDQIDFFGGDVFFGLDLQHHVVISHADFYQELRRDGVHVSFLMHDLLPVLMPKVFHESMFNVHTEWMQVLAKTDGVICVSKTVADEYANWLNTFGPKRSTPLQIGWSHNGADIRHSRPSGGMPDDALEKIKLMNKRPTFLMVGTVEPRKGQMQTLLAFEKLWRDGVDVNLVIVGKQGWDVDLLVELLRIHSERNKRLFWLEGASDEYLEAVYAASTALIAASEGEGFGLPLIEAAQHKLPIIARDIPVFREVAGKHAVYFSGNEPHFLADAVVSWLENSKRGVVVKSDGMHRLTWAESAQSLIDVLLQGNWYRNWISEDGVYKYSGSDSRLSSVVGKRDGLLMKSIGKSGYVLFGPYIPLGPGSYTVKFFGKIGKNGAAGAYADVCGTQGTQFFTRTELQEVAPGECFASLDLVLTERCDDIEVRIWVEESSDVEVSLLEIRETFLEKNEAVVE